MRLKRNALASASLAALAITTPALAQQDRVGASPAAPATEAQAANPANPDAGAPPAADTQTPATSDIVVTGYRASIRSSEALKRNAPQIVDAVVAEDIGKLPDLAVSDTAGRIPGVQVLRVGGEAESVLIRGLPEAFFNTLYNGREVFTAERRQVALQDFPSAGIAALEVFKTSTADQVEPGVIGLTNVRSRRPFDLQGFELSGNAFGVLTANTGRVTPNGNILISNRWQTGIGEIGVLVNASYTQLKYLDAEPSNTDFIATPTVNGQTVRVPDIMRLYYRSGDRKRPSANAALQWRPNDKLEFYAEGLYQGFRNSIDDTEAQANLYSGTFTNLTLRPGTNLVSSGQDVNPGPIFSFRGGTYNKTDTYQFAAGGIYNSGPFRLTVDAAHTTSRFVGSTESIDRQFGFTPYTINFNSELPQFSISGFNAADPANYRFLGLFEENQLSRGGDWQARADGEYKVDNGFLHSIQFGFRYTDRDANRRYGNRYFGGQNVPIAQAPINFLPVHPGLGDDDPNQFQTFLAPTYTSIRSNIQNLRQFVIGLGATNYSLGNAPYQPFSSYDAYEKTYAGYAQANYNFNDVIDGTIGVRYVRAETQVNGSALGVPPGAAAGAPVMLIPVTSRPNSSVFLPNASLRWHVWSDLQLRLSYTQTQTRPDFSQLNPALSLGSPQPYTGGGTISYGNGGNPTLKPYKSNNYDASLEYYFTRTGFVSVAGFHRDVRNFIQTETTNYTDPTFGFVQVSRPVNVAKAEITGAEAQLSTFFDFEAVPSFLRSFGLQANFTYIDGKRLIPTDPRVSLTDLSYFGLEGVSRYTYNIVGLYEHGPLSLRVTYNKRSQYLDVGYPQFRAPNPPLGDIFYQYGRPHGNLDLSANLNFTKKTTLFFDATNLTGNPDLFTFTSARDGAPRAEYVRFLSYRERTYSAGFRFRF